MFLYEEQKFTKEEKEKIILVHADSSQKERKTFMV